MHRVEPELAHLDEHEKGEEEEQERDRREEGQPRHERAGVEVLRCGHAEIEPRHQCRALPDDRPLPVRKAVPRGRERAGRKVVRVEVGLDLHAKIPVLLHVLPELIPPRIEPSGAVGHPHRGRFAPLQRQRHFHLARAERIRQRPSIHLHHELVVRRRTGRERQHERQRPLHFRGRGDSPGPIERGLVGREPEQPLPSLIEIQRDLHVLARERHRQPLGARRAARLSLAAGKVHVLEVLALDRMRGVRRRLDELAAVEAAHRRPQLRLLLACARRHRPAQHQPRDGTAEPDETDRDHSKEHGRASSSRPVPAKSAAGGTRRGYRPSTGSP